VEITAAGTLGFASTSPIPARSGPTAAVPRPPTDPAGLATDGWDPAVPLLVALHGWLLSGRLWDPLRHELEPVLPCWCPDLPGFGGRPRPKGLQPSLASYGRWLADELLSQAGGRPVVLLGHSLGGSVALHAAPHLGTQLRALVQVAAGGGVYQPRPFARLRQAGSAFLALRPAWLAPLPALAPWRSPLVAEARAARGLLACSTNRGAVSQLPRLTADLGVPSLWIAGSRDGVMEPRYVRHLAGYSRQHRLVLLEGAGHLPMRQMPGRLAALIQLWLQEEGILAGDTSRESPLLGSGPPLSEAA
jgi:pimeloyl-ACP methyl ester carboxylesterase